MKLNIFKLLLLLIFYISNLAFGGVGILNGLIHEFNVMPGNTYKGFIELNNSSVGNQVVAFNQTDMKTSFSGETFYADTVNYDRSNLSWIKLSTLNITLTDEETRTVEFEITVPNNADLYGSYWSVIMVEPRDPIHVQEDSRGFNIQSKIRYAIQIVCTFGESGTTNLNFVDITQTTRESNRYLEIGVQNTGDVIVKPVLSLELFDELGNSYPIKRVENKRIFPNSSKKYLLDITDIKSGNYQGIVIADCNTDDLFGVNITINIKDDG